MFGTKYFLEEIRVQENGWRTLELRYDGDPKNLHVDSQTSKVSISVDGTIDLGTMSPGDLVMLSISQVEVKKTARKTKQSK
jgi:hypothetical protein